MAETIPSASTFDAITASYTSKVLVDQIFVGTPTLLEAKRHLTPMRADETGSLCLNTGRLPAPCTPSVALRSA